MAGRIGLGNVVNRDCDDYNPDGQVRQGWIWGKICLHCNYWVFRHYVEDSLHRICHLVLTTGTLLHTDRAGAAYLLM
jgi:hypothetical protein